jgi:hypothetical protein
LFILFVFLPGNVCFSQSGEIRILQDLNIKEFRSFKILYLKNNILSDTAKPDDKKFIMTKSPWKAVLYSAVVPGLGQLYNKSYWKIPVIAGIGGYLGYTIIRNNNKFLDYRDEYANSQTPENPQGNTILKDYREFYRNQRDQFIQYFALLYLVNLIDAYVDAHLFDFDVSDKIKISFNNNISQLNFKINF